MAKKASPQKAKSSASRPKTTWLSLLDSDHCWDEKDDVLDAVYWWRQVAAIVIGIIYGYLGLHGSVAIISYIILISVFAHMVATRTGFDFDPDDGFVSVKEGFMTSFATFLVSWIVTYTAIHFD